MNIKLFIKPLIRETLYSTFILWHLVLRSHVNHFECRVYTYEHWPDNREFITRTIELWNRWIRLSCYYNRV